MKYAFIFIITNFLFVQCTPKKNIDFEILEEKIESNNLNEFKKLYNDIGIDTFLNRWNQNLLVRAIVLNRPHFVDYLLKENKLSIDVLDNSKLSPFHYAVSAIDQKSAIFMLDYVDLTIDSIYFNIVDQAFLKRHTNIKVIAHILNYREEEKNSEFGPLYSSIIFGECDKFYLLIEKGYQLNKDYGSEGDIYQVAKKYGCNCLKRTD